MNGQSQAGDCVEECAGDKVNDRVVNVDLRLYLPIVIEVMRAKHITRTELGRRTGLSKFKISRCLGERREIDGRTLNALFDVLEIDGLRALLAIIKLKSWERYFDPDLEVIADLVQELPACLSAARSAEERSPVGLAGAKVLAKRVSEMVATNDRETHRRRRDQPLYGT